MRRTTRNALIAAAAVLLVACAVFWLLRRAGDSPAGAGGSAVAAQTIQGSGEIAGLRIGMSMAEARQKLDPLRAPGVPYQPDAKEEQDRRILWRLAGTEYEWVMAWASAQGKITRVRGFFRADQRKTFAKIGDMTRAVTADETTVRWHQQTPDGKNYRLVAQGPQQQAMSVFMFLQELPSREHERDAGENSDPSP